MNLSTQTSTREELETIVRAFPDVLDALKGSYSALAERAERVEEELQAANVELESKVRELDQVKSHLQAVLESLPSGVLERDQEGRVIQANHAARRILGLDEAGLRRQPTFLESTGLEPTHYDHPAGGTRYLEIRRSGVTDSDGNTLGEVEIIDDHTERMALERRLRSADKMASLGTMAGGIAHEIRNPLNAIQGFATLLLDKESLDDKSRRWIQNIIEAATRTDTIIESMLSFGNPERVRTQLIDGDELLREVARIVREDFQDTDFTFDIEASAPRFRGDDHKLIHALRNLVANAIQVQEGKPRITVNLFLDTDEIVLRVDDAGPGINSELARQMLDPFFTTRADGTGIGMTLVDTIARLHGGHVHIHSTPSPLGGARIDLRIPYISPTAGQTTRLV